MPRLRDVYLSPVHVVKYATLGDRIRPPIGVDEVLVIAAAGDVATRRTEAGDLLLNAVELAEVLQVLAAPTCGCRIKRPGGAVRPQVYRTADGCSFTTCHVHRAAGDDLDGDDA